MSRLDDLRLDIDPVQTRLAMGYMPSGFVGHKILSPYLFQGQTGKVPKYLKEGFQIPETLFPTRSPRPKQIEWTVQYDTISIARHGLESHLDVEEVQAGGIAGINAVTRARTTAQHAVETRREYEAATLLQTEATYGGNVDAATDTWDTFTNGVSDADPLVDIAVARAAIVASTGMLPNVAWCSYELWLAIQLNTYIIARMPGGNGSESVRVDISERQFANLIGVEEFYVGRSRYATSATAATLTSIWDDDFFGMAYRVPNPTVEELPTFGHTILRQFGEADGVPVTGLAGTDLLTPWASAYWYVTHYNHEVLFPTAGYLLKTCHS